MSRRAELAASLAAVHERIATACDASSREREDVTLVVVTKTYPASDVGLLADLGVTDVGENRHPEAGEKAAAVAEPLRWHFLGALQTNKAGAVARYADVVHSVDRPRLVASLSRGAVVAGRELGCFVQVDFGDAGGRSGTTPDGALALADAVAGAPGLRLDGLMTVAPLGVDPAPVFESLMSVSARVRAEHPEATAVSAGMSGDFEAAIAAGATHLRIGRSILGERPSLG